MQPFFDFSYPELRFVLKKFEETRIVTIAEYQMTSDIFYQFN